MADGGSSGGPHTAAAGVKCCRACTAAAPRSTVRFKLIEGACAKAGALPRLGFDEGLLFQRQHHMSAILTASCRDRSMKGWDNVRDMLRRRTPPRYLSPGRTSRDRQSHAHGVHVQA